MVAIKIPKRGLNAEQFAKVLKAGGACASARRALRGKSLNEFWKTSKNGPWMGWWLFSFACQRDVRDIPGVYFGRLMRDSGSNWRKREADMAQDIRAVYNFDGTRKDGE